MTSQVPGSPPRLRIAVVANTSWYLYNFRRNLMQALADDGHEVLALGGEADYGHRLQAEGFAHCPVAFTGTGTNPMRELRTVAALRREFLRRRIDVVLSYTPKGNIYSALAMSGLKTALVMNVSGLGAAFSRDGWLAATVRMLFRQSIRRAGWVFFQNQEDLSSFRDARMVDPLHASLVPGSGVDLRAFQPTAHPPQAAGRSAPLFLMVARLLWDKGVGEFVEAARLVRATYPQARFRLLGPLMPDHRAAVPAAQIRAWVEAGLVEYPGAVDDVRPHLAEADCVVLPSVYREGVPRALLEGAAMARPIIATDSVGCRNAVDDGRSGFLCRPRDPVDLCAKMLAVLRLEPEARTRMGAAGRLKMEREFDERLVINAYRQRLQAMTPFAAST
jgi:glycosyltransferase involved in cell wall biosynthesis